MYDDMYYDPNTNKILPVDKELVKELERILDKQFKEKSKITLEDFFKNLKK